MEHDERGLLRIPVLDDLMSYIGTFTDDQLVGAVKRVGLGLTPSQIRDYLVLSVKRGVVKFDEGKYSIKENLSDKLRQPSLDIMTYHGKNLEGEETTLREVPPTRFFTRYSPN